MIWSIHLHDYVQKLLIFQGWFFVSWKILGLEIAPQLVGKVHHPWRPLPLPCLGLKGDFSSSFSMIRNFGMDFLGGEMLLSISRYFFELPILEQRGSSSCSKYRVISRFVFHLCAWFAIQDLKRTMLCLCSFHRSIYCVNNFSGSCV